MPPSFQAPDGQWTTRTAMYRDIQAWAQSSLLSPVRALSVDRNPELERILLDRWPALQVTHAVHPEIDCQHLPFPAGSFDLVFSDQVIEHVPEPWRAASEFERVLKPGGIGIHTTCAFNPRHGPPAFEDYYRFLPAGLAALFKSSSVERLGEWGSREALLHHLEVDEAVAPQIARSFSAEVGEQTDGRYPWVTWIVARLCSQTVPLWEVSAESLWREVAAEEVRQAMRSLLERLTLDPLVTPRILDRMGRPDPRTGKPYIDGRMLLFWLAHRIRPTHVLEVGVRRGFSLAAVSHAAPEAHLVGFDQWMKDYGGVENPGPNFVLEELSRVGHKGPIHLISGDSHQTLPAFFAGKVTLDDGHSLEPPETFQLINIDGDHSIAGSWADLLDVVDRVAPGGALVFDDLNVDYIPEGDFRVGQYGVWTAFKRRFADQFHFLEYLDSIPGLGLAIRYPEPRPDRRILLNTQVGPDAVPPPRVEPEQAEMDLVRELVKPGMTAFDIGAHIGKYTKLFAHLVGPEGRVHAFEPTPTTFKRLQGCWGAESPSQVTLVPKLVTTRPGIFPFHLFPEQYSTWNSLGKPQMADPQAQDRLVPIAKQISVPGTSLDAYCDLQGITEIDYLKLDVEGAESEALGGMEGLLSRQAIRFLQFEISQKPLEGMGHQARETFAMLARHGYVCRPIEAGGRLGPVVFDSDAFYANHLAHKPGDPALEHLIRPTPIHFFTIVLNGRPFIEHHIRELTKLDVPWHWHIVEGVALQHHDSSWMLHHGGRVEENLHRNGLSHDGTTEYLDALARAYPDRITVYRKPHGQAWDGKLEMVNAPLENIQEACLLWQIDADELWTAEQIHEAHRMFEAEPHRRTAVYRCQFFVGPEHVISTRDTYGNPTDRTAWNRTWRYVPGCRWKSHSPPILVEPHKDKWVDLYEEAPFLHEETEARGLVFQHFAFADECQLAFKEVYYGYTGAVEGWRKLQRHDAFPARLREFFPWVQDEALVVPIQELGVTPLAYQTPEGCWQFRGESPLRQEPKKGIRIAGEVDEGHDLTEVSGDSEFATSIRALFSKHRPKRLLETGTYLGQGTTATIARTLDELGIESGRFLSLEVNPSNHRTARKNLSEAGLSHRVDLVNALSVPRDMLPTLKQIDEWTRRNIAYDDIFVDHAEHERAKLYFQETHFESVPDDGLRKALKVLEWRPDFVLLDSGGHMGNVEFNYLLELLEGPCFIALDDVFHIKHRRSLEQIQTDPRFELLTLSHEKFGFCIARFDPGPVPPKPLVEHILWIRLDAIGDALLAASMLEPLRGAFPGARISVVCQPECSETYATCPLANDVWTVDRSQALQDPGYLQAVLEELAGLGIDLCIPGSSAPDALEEALASASGAPSWNPAPSAPKDNKALKIIYVKLDAIGDAIIALDLLEKIHSHHRPCQITVVCQHHVQEIYRMMDMDLEIIPIEKSKISTDDTYIDSWIHKIQQNTYDLCLHPTFSRDDFSDFLVSKIQATDKIGHYGDAVNRDPSRGRIWDTAYTTLCPQNETWKSELEHHQDFLNTLHIEGNVDIFTLKADPSLRTAFKQKLDAFFQGQRTEYLAIGWGAGWDKRRYGRMPEVIQLIQEEFPQAFGFVFLGSSTEHEAIEHLIHSHDLQDCLNLAGATTFREAAAVIDLCTLVLGAESSLSHLATALGKRSITLVGGGHFGRFLPHSHLNTLVLRPLHCYHCNWACPYENTHCIQDINPETIVDALKTTIINFEDTNIHLFVDESNQNDIKKPQLVHPDEIINIDSVKCHCKSNIDPETSSIQDRPSVIIPSYQRPELLDRAITSLLNESHPIGVDVIVICNSQDAPTIQIAQSHGCRILFDDACIGPEGKFSWASAMNLGFRNTKSKWVMFGSDDIEIQNHSITKSICYAELMGDSLGSVAIPHKNECLQNNYPEDTLKLHFSLSYSGLNMINYGFINKNYYKASLGFNNKYSFYASDWDLCFKIHQLTGKIIHLWDSSIKHNNTLDALKQNNQIKFINDIKLLSYNWENHPVFPESRTANGAILLAANREIYHVDIALRIADLALCNRIDEAIEKTKTWLQVLPDFGFLHIFMGALTMMQNPASSAIDPMFARGQALGWEGNWRELLHNLALQYAKSITSPPKPNPRTTVFCAVWHRDPDRHALLKGHQACLDAQLVPVERIYVFDGGDAPPPWLKGRHIVRPVGLSIYEAWALALEAADTPYVANLNLDDRLNPDAVAIFERVLDEGTDLVGGDWQICFSQAETDAVARSQEATALPFDPAWPPRPGKPVRLGSGLGERGTLGPACAWRRDLHRQIRGFPTRFGDGSPVRVIGDALWWRLVSEAGKTIKRLPILLGRYHSHPEGQAEFRTPAETEEAHYRRHGLG